MMPPVPLFDVLWRYGVIHLNLCASGNGRSCVLSGSATVGYEESV